MSVIGRYYYNQDGNISVPASTNTLILRNPEVEFGTYLVIGRVELKSTQPQGGALFAIYTTNNGNYIQEILPVAFLANGTIVGIAEFKNHNDYARLYYYSTQAVDINFVDISLIRIK